MIVDPDCLLHQQIANGGTHLVDQIASMGLVYLSTVCLILEVNVGIYIYTMHGWHIKRIVYYPVFRFIGY